MGTTALGPVVTEVLAEAPCPVLLEWAITAPVNRARTQPVCCAIAFDGSQAAVLSEAVWAAERMEAPLKIVCALQLDGRAPGRPYFGSRPAGSAKLRSFARGSRVCATAWAPGSAVQVGVGLPVSVFSRAIRLHGAGLLVTGGSREVTPGGGIGMPCALCRTWQPLAGRTARRLRRREDCVVPEKSLAPDPASGDTRAAAPYLP